MKLTLTPPEIARAIQVYLGAKMNVAPDSLGVRLRWRGEYAEVWTKPVPTLTDVAGSER
jgi:hypothetical protein